MGMIRRLFEMIRFSHTIFALPFALLSATLAWQDEPFRWLDLVGILLCMVTVRSAAMGFNRLVDRRIDALNPRTAGRHLPVGTLSLTVVVGFTLACCVAFIASVWIFYWREPSNPWPLYLAGPVLIFVLAYSFTKRFTVLAHFWLGSSLMLAPMAAWIAIRGLTDLMVPCLLGGAVLFWVAGFDILYACQDAEFDRKAKLSSIPAKFGIPSALRIAAVSHVVMFGFLVALTIVSPHLRIVFACGLALIGALLAYEHRLVRPDDLTRVNQAFFQVNGVISIGLCVLVWLQLVIGW